MHGIDCDEYFVWTICSLELSVIHANKILTRFNYLIKTERTESFYTIMMMTVTTADFYLLQSICIYIQYVENFKLFHSFVADNGRLYPHNHSRMCFSCDRNKLIACYLSPFSTIPTISSLNGFNILSLTILYVWVVIALCFVCLHEKNEWVEVLVFDLSNGYTLVLHYVFCETVRFISSQHVTWLQQQTKLGRKMHALAMLEYFNKPANMKISLFVYSIFAHYMWTLYVLHSIHIQYKHSNVCTRGGQWSGVLKWSLSMRQI